MSYRRFNSRPPSPSSVSSTCVGEFHDGRRQEVILLEPGGLTSSEAILPPMFRWKLLLAVISDIVKASTEFWVVGPVEAYLGSWWTQGELSAGLTGRTTPASGSSTRRLVTRPA
ncbi:MAG: hypothetical protein R2705_13085 [Ilumatobacteraceae bacterium]